MTLRGVRRALLWTSLYTFNEIVSLYLPAWPPVQAGRCDGEMEWSLMGRIGSRLCLLVLGGSLGLLGHALLDVVHGEGDGLDGGKGEWVSSWNGAVSVQGGCG